MFIAEHVIVRDTAAYSVEVICKIIDHNHILLEQVAVGRREFIYSCVWFIFFRSMAVASAFKNM